jgi:hypothetical protein
MPKVYQHYSTVCCGCSKIVGRHWFWERSSMRVSRDDEHGSEGISVSDKKPCPYCNGEKLAGFRGDYPIGTDVSDKIKQSKCRRCGVAFHITDATTKAVLHEDSKSDNKHCGECRVVVFLEQNPNPSDGSERYTFDRWRIEWAVSKVKVVCPDCKKDRWIAPTNAHKVRCEKCYRAQPTAKRKT